MSLRRLGTCHNSNRTGAHGGSTTRVSGISSCAASVAMRCAVRTHMNGFGLFTRELQRSKGALPARNLQQGQANIKKAARLWKALGARVREGYNRRARAMTVVRTVDDEKRYNLFNLTMKLLSERNVFNGVGSEKLNAWIARETARRMSPRAARQLRARYSVASAAALKKAARTRQPASVTTNTTGVETGTVNMALSLAPDSFSAGRESNFSILYRQFHFPSMRYFSSFTEMQRGVCPTAHAFFTSTCLLGRVNVSHSTYASTAARFHLLPPDAQDLFGPITDEESAAFEVFCARPIHCAEQDPEHFNIVLLAALFRNLPVEKPVPSTRDVALYRGIATVERVREGPYLKVRRCLLRARHSRSSECGAFLYRQLPDESVCVPRGTYGIQAATSIHDTDVARLLVSTRVGHSVYDDVLNRAAPLRPALQQKLLKIYDVHATAEERREAVAVAPKVKPHVAVVAKVRPHVSAEPAQVARHHRSATREDRKTVSHTRKASRPAAKKTKVPASAKVASTVVITTSGTADQTEPVVEERKEHDVYMARPAAAVAMTKRRTKKTAGAVTARRRGRSVAAVPNQSKTARRTATTVAASPKREANKKVEPTALKETTAPSVAADTTVPSSLRAGDYSFVAEDEAMTDDIEMNDEDAFVMSATEEEASAASRARHAEALAAIANIGLKPARASQRVRRAPAVAKATAARQRTTATAPTTKTEAAANKARPVVATRRGERRAGKAAALARAPRARQRVKAAASTISSSVGKPTSARPRETREDRQQRVQQVILSGKKQRILHGHQAQSKTSRTRRGGGAAASGKSTTRAQVATSLANALRAQLSSMQS